MDNLLSIKERMTKFLNDRDWRALQSQFLSNKPFNHIVMDDFFAPEVVEQLVKEFPAYEAEGIWNAHYKNPIENKKACNHWDKFPRTTYSTFHYLCSFEFENIISQITGNPGVQADVGLHGGGWHAHATAGKLNVHLDYSIHPKLQLERHYNLIVYITPDWQTSWGGGLEVWDHNEDGTPSTLHGVIENKFNRAVLFDTTQQSWHGLPKDLNCPEGTMRQSMAVYYVTEPADSADTRSRALFVPHGVQADDPAILELIKLRGAEATAEKMYKGLK
jgi:Rps23 Pro-64 3,4-dihydroxylase Tpa1-like proline 4-hydroxylase